MAKKRRPLTQTELDAQQGAELPTREALSLVFGSVAPPAGLLGTLGAAAGQSGTTSSAAEGAESIVPSEPQE